MEKSFRAWKFTLICEVIQRIISSSLVLSINFDDFYYTYVKKFNIHGKQIAS
jgi:hypothetical protein